MSSIDPNRNMVCAAVDLPRLGTIYSEVKGPPERVVERGPHQKSSFGGNFRGHFLGEFSWTFLVNFHGHFF